MEGLRIGKKVIDPSQQAVLLVKASQPGGVKKCNDPRNQGVLAFARLVTELKPRYSLDGECPGIFVCCEYELVRVRLLPNAKKCGLRRSPVSHTECGGLRVPLLRDSGCSFSATFDPKPSFKADPVPDPGLQPTVRETAMGDLAALDKFSNNAQILMFTMGRWVKLSSMRPPCGEAERHRIRADYGCLRTRHTEEVGLEPWTRPAPKSWPPLFPPCLGWRKPYLCVRHWAGSWQPHGSSPYSPRVAAAITVRRRAMAVTRSPTWLVFHGTRWHGFPGDWEFSAPPAASSRGSGPHSAFIGRR